MGMTRKLKDGWVIYDEWVYVDENGKREHWVETKCPLCGYRVEMPLSKLVADGPDLCEDCGIYKESKNE